MCRILESMNGFGFVKCNLGSTFWIGSFFQKKYNFQWDVKLFFEQRCRTESMYFKEQIKKIFVLAFNYNIIIYICRDLSGRIYNQVIFKTVS